MYRKLGKGSWILAAIAALAFASSAYAADPSFDAHGSVEQVYATDLSPGEQVAQFFDSILSFCNIFFC